MALTDIHFELSIKEIYNAVCKNCKKKIRALIKEKVTDQMVDQVIGTGK